MSACLLLNPVLLLRNRSGRTETPLLGYQNGREESDLDLTEIQDPVLIYISDTTNEEVLEETDYIVYAEVNS